MKKFNCIILFCMLLVVNACTEKSEVSKVHIIFKTHLDIGFTDLSSVVEQRYIQEFIPKAMIWRMNFVNPAEKNAMYGLPVHG